MENKFFLLFYSFDVKFIIFYYLVVFINSIYFLIIDMNYGRFNFCFMIFYKVRFFSFYIDRGVSGVY